MTTGTTITLKLSADIYRRLQQAAHVTRRPLQEVASQSLRGNLPPAMDDLPPEYREELLAWHSLSDDALWTIAQGTLSPTQWRRHRHLLRKNQARTLTSAQRKELTGLREAADRLVIRRSYALALLKWRGHVLPIPHPLTPYASTPQNPRRRSTTSR